MFSSYRIKDSKSFISLPEFEEDNVSRFIGGCLSLLLLAGCGGSEPRTAHAPVYPVHGKVTYKGQPVVGATLTFTSASANRSAFGITDDKGVYHLTTFNANDGAVEGQQTVTIEKYVAPVATAPEVGVESEDYVPPGYETAPPPPVDVAGLLPAKYAKAETSGLMAVVNAEPGNEIDFDLKD